MFTSLLDDELLITLGCHAEVRAVLMRIALEDGVSAAIARAVLGPFPLLGSRSLELLDSIQQRRRLRSVHNIRPWNGVAWCAR